MSNCDVDTLKNVPPPHLCRLEPKYYKIIAGMLTSRESIVGINSIIDEILYNINTILKKEKDSPLIRTYYKEGKFVLDYKNEYESFHSQSDIEKIKFGGPSVFSTRCDCSKECKGILKYICVISDISPYENISNFIIPNDTCISIDLSGCESYLDYNLKGIYNDGFKEDVVVKYKNGSKYYGKWKGGVPHGSGVLTLTSVKREYDRICNLDVKYIKLYGNFNECLLIEEMPFKVLIVLNNFKEGDEYCMMVFENTTLIDKTFIPDKSAIITYYNSDDEDPEKYYGIFEGTTNNILMIEGEILYSNPKAMITSYKGEFKDNQFYNGKCIFAESHSLSSFEGKYNNKGPIFGIKKYKNCAEYNGYVNNYYHSNGEGILDKTNIHDVTCECCSKVVKPDTHHSSVAKVAFDTKEGMWLNDKLVFEHTLSKVCDKPKCNNIKSVACLTCREYYCKECYERHQNLRGPRRSYRFHDVMKLFHEKDPIDPTDSIEPKKSIEMGKYLEDVFKSKSTKITFPPPSIPPREMKPSEPITNHYLSDDQRSPITDITDITDITVTNSSKKGKHKKKQKQKKKKTKRKKKTTSTPTPNTPLSVRDIVGSKGVDILKESILSELGDVKYSNVIGIRDVQISIEEVEPGEEAVEAETTEAETVEYDSSFDDLLKQMKLTHNSDLTKIPH